ncbi:hypothetical protein [Mycolicibacterium austroafricanum]|uniref:hypothetical protein n=1 Tax=Mycolicibacterium austroafricanum TaxID=39687 RepID=UPI001CA354BA|nr:hypothetical protein [Mycolicibacterium austroafricanum]QZT60288.1 hypothetical protein JN085_14520 [Mycolicibacterium austroafricanum]
MTLAGLALPELSAFDPPLAGEGSLDPMGLAAISDRLADRLVPGLRARMQRIRFVTAMAIGAMVCETLIDEMSADGISTPSICFEWLVVEGLVRRIPPQDMPRGVPGSQKARAVVKRGQRLSAATYLKSPSVFGFNGIYKPFALDAQIVSSELEPGPRCAEITRSWEAEQGFVGFTDAVPGTDGGRLRTQLRDQVRDALHAGRCTTGPSSWLFGRLAASLHPYEAGPEERHSLRTLITTGDHESRTELAHHLERITDELSEAAMLDAVRPFTSPTLRRIIDAVVAYERFAILVDAAFRTLCAVSHSMGAQPLTATSVAQHVTIARCAQQLPSRYSRAAERMAAIDAEGNLEERLGEFAIPRSANELVGLLLEHHERIQADKPPQGKRSWFEPFRDGWVVRDPYGQVEQPALGNTYVHPVRVAALRRFLEDTVL